VTDEVEVRLEYEAAYEWLAFVSQRNSDVGALTKYFGRSADGEYKYRGIECRQRSTCEFVADAWEAFIETFDECRDPGRVCNVLQERLARLRRGDVLSSSLVTTIQVWKRLEAYDRRSRTTAALEWARRKILSTPPVNQCRSWSTTTKRAAPRWR